MMAPFVAIIFNYGAIAPQPTLRAPSTHPGQRPLSAVAMDSSAGASIRGNITHQLFVMFLMALSINDRNHLMWHGCTPADTVRALNAS